MKLSGVIEQVDTIINFREHYKYHKYNHDEKFSRIHLAKIKLYTAAPKAIVKAYNMLINQRILSKLDNVQKKNTLIKEYSGSVDLFSEIEQYKKNYENYMVRKLRDRRYFICQYQDKLKSIPFSSQKP